MPKGFLDWTTKLLVVVGAINWGLGIWNINLVALLSLSWLITTVYALIGISGLVELVKLFKK